MKARLTLFYFLVTLSLFSQEITCNVIVNSDLIDQTDKQIFNTLEKSLNEFVNTTIWTQENRSKEERLVASFIFNLTSFSGSQFDGSLQIQAERTAYNSDYQSSISNFLDSDISFTYEEYQSMFYNPIEYSSNLISLMSFYVYVLLGIEADSFQYKGGDYYFNEAQKILNLAQQSGFKGWEQNDRRDNRYWLIDSLNSSSLVAFRQAVYTYHREGLDKLSENQSLAKKNILKSIKELEHLYSLNSNSILLRLFFETKSDEIMAILSGGEKVDLEKTKKTLNKIAPFFTSKWKKLR